MNSDILNAISACVEARSYRAAHSAFTPVSERREGHRLQSDAHQRLKAAFGPDPDFKALSGAELDDAARRSTLPGRIANHIDEGGSLDEAVAMAEREGLK